MPLQNIIITSSINSIVTQSYGQRTYIASTDEQSFPIEEITGSYGGVWPSFIQNTNYTIGLVTNVTQSWSASNITPVGEVSYIHNTMEEFVNGEFSGSNIVVSDGSLTDEFCQQFLEVSTEIVEYSIFPYIKIFNNLSGLVEDDPLSEFIHRYTVPNPGQILIYVYQTKDPDVIPTYYTGQIVYAKIHRIDQSGYNNTPSLEQLEKIIWIDGSIGKIELDIITITEYQNYYLYEFAPKTFLNTPSFFIGDDNYLDYTLETTSSYTGPLNAGYNYLTSSWTTITDTANGFTSGSYIFPLTPNCNIQLSTSIDITVSTSCSFSLAINAYDPIYPTTVPNANNYGFTINAPLLSNTNSYVLVPGVTHSIIVTSSAHQPIQEYLYQINAYIADTDQAVIANTINGDLSATSTEFNSEGQLLPSASGLNPPAGASYFSVVTDGTISPNPLNYDLQGGGWNTFASVENLSTANGVVYLANTTIGSQPSSITNTGSILIYDDPGALSFIPWSIGTTYNVVIEIPPPFYGTNWPDAIYGPPSDNIIVNINSANPYNPTYNIGIIPSGAYGLLSFPVTITDLTNQDTINILAPFAASKGTDVNVSESVFMISSITIIPQVTASIHGLSFNITQSQIPQTATSSIILEPFLFNNFYYSDCDVLINNFSQNEFSNIVRRVNYDFGSTIPSNLEQIIDGTAEYAEVNDYLYNVSANILPRYSGVRTTSPGFNMSPSINGFNSTQQSELEPSSIVGVGVPNVENTTTYFAYFSELKSNNPIFKGTTSPIIKYLIGEDGVIYTPSTDNAAYFNLQGSFPRDSKAYCNLLYQSSPIFNSTQSIILSGESYTPILYNIESADSVVAVFTSSISLINLQGITSNNIAPPSYSLYVQSFTLSPISDVGSPTNMFYYGGGSASYDPNGTWSGPALTLPIYSQGYTIDSTVQTSIKVTVGVSNLKIYSPADAIVVAKLWTYNTTSLTTTLLATKSSNNFQALSGIFPQSRGGAANSILKLETTIVPSPNDILYVTLEKIGTGDVRTSAYYFKIETLGVSIPQIGPTFWTTGSANSISLTSSIELGAALQGNYRQEDIENSGFDPIQFPCTIEIGDEFRFEYDENNTYKVVDRYFSNDSSINTTASLLNFDVTNLYNQVVSVGSSSFSLNGSVNFILTGSAPPYINTPTDIYLTGSTSVTNAASEIVLAINNSASVSPYDAFISDISASSATNFLNLYAITSGTNGNSYYLTSGSIYNFSGGVGTPGGTPILYVILDRPIINNVTLNINHFLVRRKIKDAITGISFRANLFNSVQDGFLIPEYPSQTIQSNISNIIEDLISKGIV